MRLFLISVRINDNLKKYIFSRISIPQTAFSVFKSASEDLDSIGKTVKKADEVLQDLGQLKRQMHNILQVKMLFCCALLKKLIGKES